MHILLKVKYWQLIRPRNKTINASLTVEAALVFPIFLLILFTILYLIKVVYIHEQVQYAITQAGQEMAVSAYLLEKSQLIDLQQETYGQAINNLEQLNYSVDDIIFNGQQAISILRNVPNFNFGSDPIKGITIESEEDEEENLIDKITTIIKEISSIKTQVSDLIISSYNIINSSMESIQILMEDSKGIISSMGAVAGIELINNMLGTKIASHIVNDYISDEEYKKWGIVNGKDGMDYSRSTFMLENEDIHIIVYYKIKIPFFSKIINEIPMKQSIKLRAFTGNENFTTTYEPISKNQKNTNHSMIVFVTKNGQKYHTCRSCQYIDIKIISTTYGEVKDSKRLCEICQHDDVQLTDDTRVFSTEKSDIFHTNQSCWTISREVFPIDLNSAVQQGYELCSKCEEESLNAN